MQKRRPDLIVMLALFVGLGVVVTTTVQGAAPLEAPQAAAQDLGQALHDDSDVSPGRWFHHLRLGAGLALAEIGFDASGIDVRSRPATVTTASEDAYVFIGVERRW